MSYLTIALGFALVFGAGRVLNLSQGAFYLLSAYLTYWFAGLDLFRGSALPAVLTTGIARDGGYVDLEAEGSLLTAECWHRLGDTDRALESAHQAANLSRQRLDLQSAAISWTTIWKQDTSTHHCDGGLWTCFACSGRMPLG